MLSLISKIKDGWLGFVSKLNSAGIPLPLARDPKKGRGSVALTLVFLSTIWVQIGLVGKWSHKLDGIDINQALTWFYACSALYWSRNFSSDGKKAEVGQGVDSPEKDQD